MSNKIKWNWGTKLLIAIILFMSFIFVLVYLSTQNSINLVEKDYYPKGLKYQTRIDDIKRAAELKDQFNITQTDELIILTIPEINPDSGSIVFFRPSDQQLDMTSEIEPDSSGRIYFPYRNFKRGIYIYKIHWYENGNGFYIEDKFFID
ncbi:MAG: hypothetical protein DRJ02_01830 [Bacteroidetes bacterium]|nr:MAG: hypothetical protein DRI72_06655 [Bacteroidota bacterium]RLD73688.1 MAG: hypothetical protein DRI87_03245 [Bacteroidota bacterium]RLD89301.1 MAG: hypothetical protein DRJ02_01830 [Bacteroidota bacterium]